MTATGRRTSCSNKAAIFPPLIGPPADAADADKQHYIVASCSRWFRPTPTALKLNEPVCRRSYHETHKIQIPSPAAWL